MSRSGPSFRQQARPLVKCEDCKGKGTTQGLFFEMPCPRCGEAGFVDGTTGEQLEERERILQLRMRLNREIERRKAAEAKVIELKNPTEKRGHGPMGQRYYGD